MNFIKTFFKQSFYYGFSTFFGRFINYLLVPLYTNIFHPSEYGIIAELYAYASFLLVLFTYGMETTFFRFSQIYEQNKVYKLTISSIFCSSLFFLMLFAISIKFISEKLGYSNKVNLLWLIFFIVLTDAIIAFPFAKLRLNNNAKAFSLLKLTNVLFNVCLNIIFFIVLPNFFKVKEFINIKYILISNLLANIFTLFLVKRDILIKPYFDFAILKDMLLYSIPLLISGLTGMINETLDRAILKHLITNKEEALTQLGIYAANYKLSIIMTLFIQTYRFTAEPIFFSYYKEKDAKLFYARMFNYFSAFSFLIFLLLSCFLHFFQYFIGKEYRVGLFIVPILLLANIFFGLHFNLSIWYKLTNKTNYGAAISIFGAIITILANLILVPKIGYVGAAYATLLCYSSITLLSYILGKKYYPIPYNIKKFFYYLSTSIIIFKIYNFVKTNNYIIDSFIALLSLFVYLIIVFIANKSEFLKLLSFKNK